MEKEILNSDKELLLKDLCARLPYGVKYSCDDIKNVWRLKTIFTRSDNSIFCDGCNALELCKPYLFPLSSMTGRLKAELFNLRIDIEDPFQDSLCEIDFYHRNHFDYRGLIPMGLALDATGLNIY